ncbi:cytochrome P450 [Tanacetum coccineum]
MSEEIANITVKSLWGNPFFDFATKPSNGKSGRILAIWNQRKFTPISSSISDGFLAVLGWWQSVEVPCLFVVVYAPQNQRKKGKRWTNIESIIASHDTISIIMGDFNEVRNVAERQGTAFCQAGAGLSDLPLGGRRFTRINKVGSQLSKLDRILV